MKSMSTFLAVLVFLLVSTTAAWSATLTVGPGETYTTIQSAVTAASGGDIILVKEKLGNAPYEENVNIPGGKNGLTIKAYTGNSPILDGTNLVSTKVAFRVNSDNVTIEGFTIQNYYWGSSTNVAYGQATRGVGIESLIASSQHTFTNNTFDNCNWGIYVREGNNITVSNNTFTDILNSGAATWPQMGGSAIVFESAGVAMDDNIIEDNTITDADYHGIFYGRVGGSVGADFTRITGNSVNSVNSIANESMAYAIFNIKQHDAFLFEDNTSDICIIALRINSSSVTDNSDLTVQNNFFKNTTSSIEVVSNDLFPGDKLYSIMAELGNEFDEGTPATTAGAMASLEWATDAVTADGGFRYIRNQFQPTVDDAENYVNTNSPENARVYILDGYFATNTPAIVNFTSALDELLIFGQSINVKLVSPAAISIILDIQSGTVEVDPITFILDVTNAAAFVYPIGIQTNSANTNVHDCRFESINYSATDDFYSGVKILDGGLSAIVKDNYFTGAVGYGVQIETSNPMLTPALIECNTFDCTNDILSNRAIDINEIAGGGDINYINVINNTFKGDFAYGVTVVNPTITSGNINIGTTLNGNIFESGDAVSLAVSVNQLADNQVNIANNAFYDGFTAWVSNLGGFILQARFNYWEIPSILTPPIDATEITAKFNNTVEFLPIYTSDDEVLDDPNLLQDNGICGFQPLVEFLWTPIYTTDAIGNDMLTGTFGNEYFLTVADALASVNTNDNDNFVVYLTLDEADYTYNETATLNVNYSLTIGAAPVQVPGNITIEPVPLVKRTNAGVVFSLNQDGFQNNGEETTLYNMTIESFGGATDYPVYVVGGAGGNVTGMEGMLIESCNFDVSAVGGPTSAIRFSDDMHGFSGPGSDINYIVDSYFAYDNGNHAIDFNPTAGNYTEYTDIIDNTFSWGGITSTSLAVNYATTFDSWFIGNIAETGIRYTVEDLSPDYTGSINISDNSFGDNSASSIPFAIEFLYPTGPSANILIDGIGIVQNSFVQIGTVIDFADGNITGQNVNNFNTIIITQNYFESIGVNAIDAMVAAPAPTGKIMAVNNEWFSDYGPDAYESAPAWHEDAPGTIISNAYGYLYNQDIGGSAVPLVNATYIQYVPWWQDFAANAGPGTFTGTPFTPITNDDAVPQYDDYASLIFAITGTDDGGNIYLENVPDWTDPLNKTVEYIETNTIENFDKSLSIWGQPFWPNTTKISTIGNGAADNMFYLSGTAPRTIDFNYLEFNMRDPLVALNDYAFGFDLDVDVDVNFDFCYFNGIQGSTSPFLAVIMATDGATNTNDVTVTNSLFENIDHTITAIGIDSWGGTLTVDNTIFTGTGVSGTAASYTYGIAGFALTDITLTNSTFSNYQSGSAIASGMLLSSDGVGTGTINIYQNVFENNHTGIFIGFGWGTDDYSTAMIYNNLIMNNTVGMVHNPGAAFGPVQAFNNYWGNDNGPKSRGIAPTYQQLGSTQENTYNEDNQGNGIVDNTIFGNVDYLPFRRAVYSAPLVLNELATMINGPKFAPIVVTNNANIAQELFANFQDANNFSVPTNKIYAYQGTYSEDFDLNVDDIEVIGKLASTPNYSSGWILAPNAPDFKNAWTNGTNGANVNAPRIIYGGVSNTMVEINGDATTIHGFIFDASAKTTPYTGDPTLAVWSQFINQDMMFINNTIYLDGTDTGIDLGDGGDDNHTITYNDIIGIPGTTFLNVTSGVLVDDLLVEHNSILGGGIYLENGAADLQNIRIQYNEFELTNNAILLNGTAQFGNVVYLNINNNYFADDNTGYVFAVSPATTDALPQTSWTDDVHFNNNYLDPALEDNNGTGIEVGFLNATPLVNYNSSIDASCNWWGSINGPTYVYNPGGDACDVSHRVYFAPWLADDVEVTPNPFGFEPDPVLSPCNAGERVWVNSTAPADETVKTIIFPSLQMAAIEPSVVDGTNFNIFVSKDYCSGGTPGTLVEDISIDWNGGVSNVLFAETPATEVNIDGDFELAGVGNPYNLELGSDLRVQGGLTLDNIGCQGWFYLHDNDLTVEGHITEGYFNTVAISCQVFTNGDGFLVKENVNTGVICNFPVIGNPAVTPTPAQFVANALNYTGNNILKLRVKPTIDPVTYKGMGEDGYDVNNIWEIDFTNVDGDNPDFAMQLRFLNNTLNDGGFNNLSSYGAYWDEFPVSATQWTTKKSTSSWNGSDGVQVVNLNLETGRTDWAIFSGPTSFALSTPVDQAKNILWGAFGDDNTLSFKWSRNDVNAQYFTILGIQGDFYGPLSFSPTGSCGAPNGPWVCGVGNWNFADGYIDSFTQALPNTQLNGNWATSKFHDGAATPATVKVLYTGKYSDQANPATPDIIIDNLAQGTYYTFFVANFNYGDGSTTVPNMETGVDGMANLNLNPGATLNPRSRQTKSAVYMTLDLNSPYSTDNQPSIVYGSNPPSDLNDILSNTNYWRVNGLATGNTVVTNPLNGDALLGGYFAEVCYDNSVYIPGTNNIKLNWKGYGNNGAPNFWTIKYSENGDTKTFTTPNVNSTTNRTRNVTTNYYLVSAYDGNGKIAALYDNDKEVNFILDEPTDVDAIATGTALPTCENVAVTTKFDQSTTSTPAATFTYWEVLTTALGAVWTNISGVTLASAYTIDANNDINFTMLDYADNGYQFRARYTSNSVCDYPTLQKVYNSPVLTLSIYDDQLTGTSPVDVEACSATPSVEFTSNDGAPLTPPNSLTFQGWEVSTDAGGSWNPAVGGDYATSNVGMTYKLTVSNIYTPTNKDGYLFRAVWKNGDCGIVETGDAELTVVPNPNTIVFNGPTPNTVCANALPSGATTLSATANDWTISEWYYSSDNAATWTEITTETWATISAIANGTKLDILNIPYDADGYEFKVKFINEGVTVDCETETSVSPNLTVLLTPEFTSNNPNVAVCEYGAVATVTAAGNNLSGNVQWYYNTVANMTGATLIATGSSTPLGAGTGTVLVDGAAFVQFAMTNVGMAWDNLYIIAYNTNGTCDDFEAFQIRVTDKPDVSQQPQVSPVTVCQNSAITVSAVATPWTLAQWQISNNNTTWTNITNGAFTYLGGSGTVLGANTETLTITPADNTWDNFYVRIVYTNTDADGSCVTESNSAQFDILMIPVVNNVTDPTICEESNFAVTATGNYWLGNNIQWSYWDGANWISMTNGNTYNGNTVFISGSQNVTLSINNISYAWNNVQVRALVSNGTCSGNEVFTFNVSEKPEFTLQPVNATVCIGGTLQYDIDFTPATSVVEWQYWNGASYVTIVDGASLTANTFNIADISPDFKSLQITNSSTAIAANHVRARLTNGYCNSPVASNNANTFVTTPPQAPAPIGAQNILATKFDVTWTDPLANATSWDIMVDDNSDFLSPEFTITGYAGGSPFTGMPQCQLQKAKTYYFKVKAHNGCGSSDWSNTSNVVTLDPTVYSIGWTSGDGAFGETLVGTSTASETYTIQYYQLDAGIQVNVPSNFEVKPLGSVNWLTGNVDLTPYITLYLGTPGAKLSLPIEVRFSPSLSACGDQTGSLPHTSLETGCVYTAMNPPTSLSVSGTGTINPPSTSASNILFQNENVAGTTIEAYWTNGADADGSIAVMVLEGATPFVPVDGTNYSAFANTSLTEYSTGNYIVYYGTGSFNSGSPLSLTGLTPNVNYKLYVYTYDQCGPYINYKQASPATGEPWYIEFAYDDPAIPDQMSGVQFRNTANTADLNIYVNLIDRAGTNPIATHPAINVTIDKDGFAGTIATNSVTLPANTGTGSFYQTWTESCGLLDIHMRGYTTATNVMNTISKPIYTNDFDLNVGYPTQQSRIILWVGIPCKDLTEFKWTVGDGGQRLVVAREGLLPETPAQGSYYDVIDVDGNGDPDWSQRNDNANSYYGSGTPKTYVIGNTTGNTASVSNLEFGKSYYFRVFEYNGCSAGLTKYLDSNASFNPRSRKINCKEGNDLYNLIVDNFNVTSNKGTGVINFRTLYEMNISGFELRRIDVTDNNMDAKLVGSYMTNTELVAEGNTMTGKAYNFNDKSMTLEVGKTYVYQLTAIAFDGSRIEVAESEITITDDVYAGVEFSLSPVTVTNNDAKFMVTLGNTMNVTIEMFDVNGQKVADVANNVVLTRGSHEFNAATANLTNGTYIIVVNGEAVSAVQKFQIVR